MTAGTNHAEVRSGAGNTRAYAGDLARRYEKMLEAYRTQTAKAQEQGEGLLRRIQRSSLPEMSAKALRAAEEDQRELLQRRDGMEQNSGNRQKIGHSQYGLAGNGYDRERGAVAGTEKRLEGETARQLEDLKAEAKNRAAAASLEAEREAARMGYSDSVRVDRNMRKNYETEDTQSRADRKEETSWLQTMGQRFLNKGIMPTAEMLEAMGLSREAAQRYISAILAGYSGGGSGRRKSSKGSSGKKTEEPSGTPSGGGWGTVSSYNNAVASKVLSLAKDGQYSSALKLLNSSKKLFSEKNSALVQKTAWSNYQKSGKTMKNAATTGGGTVKAVALTK